MKSFLLMALFVVLSSTLGIALAAIMVALFPQVLG